ncbi:hypothetical protein TrRE_jg10657 [Triparma retinervis]|uniref:Fe2OG dioxygenase domain-containing protein n=1 Tax=Triparma retinervis TaxID=2557542 RepID=A0A9W6ZKT4_9STRA|nr:hypothetical protein TrRE_jg10657 [Triparma retinervis]
MTCGGNKFSVIDLSGPRASVVSLVRSAALDLGFFQVKFASTEKASALAAAKEFFSLPQKAKEGARLVPGWNGELMRGYASLGSEAADVANHSLAGGEEVLPDLMESYQVADPEYMDDGQFPTEGMKRAMPGLFDEMKGLGLEILSLLDEGLPKSGEGKFVDNHKGRSRTIVRCTKYPALEDCGGLVSAERLKSGKGVSRISAHRDLGTLTLLMQDQQGGLEVQDPETGEWFPVPPVEGAVVVNVGNLMTRWTNGVYKSSIHRVVANPGGGHLTEDRWSVIMFISPDDDFTVSPLECCAGEGEVRVAVNVGKYMNCKMRQLFDPEAREDKGKCKYDN